MTPVNGDFDRMLRFALHAEVDSIEPDENGLERIRQRMHAPWLVRQASLMLTECVDLVRLIGIRLEPSFTSARAAIAARGGAWGAFVGLLSSMVSVLAGLVVPSQRRGAAHRGGSAGAREGSNLGWLRPALAVAGAVVIVVAGVYGLAQVRDNLVLELFPGSTPASTGGGASTGHQGPTMEGQSAPAAVVPTGGRRGSAKPSPKTTCTRAPSKQQAAPSPSASASPTPTISPDPSPDPAPSDSTGPTPSDSAAAATTAALSASLAAGIQTTANVAPTTRCTSASPARKS
jgi:hypothetical protein